jgi:TonB family protein
VSTVTRGQRTTSTASIRAVVPIRLGSQVVVPRFVLECSPNTAAARIEVGVPIHGVPPLRTWHDGRERLSYEWMPSPDSLGFVAAWPLRTLTNFYFGIHDVPDLEIELHALDGSVARAAFDGTGSRDAFRSLMLGCRDLRHRLSQGENGPEFDYTWSPSLAPRPPLRVGSCAHPPPLKLRHVPPVYPPAARAAGIRGYVGIELFIDATGRVRDVRLTAPVSGLNEAAVAAARKWVFTATLLNGEPVPVVMWWTVAFDP